MAQMHNPPHPGGTLKEAIGNIPMTLTAFAVHIGVTRNALSRVVNEKARITPEMSMRLSEAFGQPTSDIWFRVQNDHDLWLAMQVKRKPVAQLPRD